METPARSTPSQQPRQMLSLRSTLASSALSCSRWAASCDGTSLVCGWRWPIGASPSHRVWCASDESAIGFSRSSDDLPAVSAIATRLPNKASTATVLTRFRMIGSPFPISLTQIGRATLPRYFILSENDCDRRRDVTKTRQGPATRRRDGGRCGPFDVRLTVVELVEVAHRLHDRFEVRSGIERVEQLRSVGQQPV